MPAHDLESLRTFRTDLHGCFPRRADALFELGDALLAAEAVGSLPHLSLQAPHRRGWGSLYDALAEGRLDVDALRATLAQDPSTDSPPVSAVDLSVWPRCDAESSPERGFYYQPSRHSAGQPIVAGWAYQFIARLNFGRESWTAPVDALRAHPMENANLVAVEQVKGLLGRLEKEASLPLFLFDAGYDPVKVQQGLEGSRCQILIRLRAGRRFYADPSLAGRPSHTGRPRPHGPI